MSNSLSSTHRSRARRLKKRASYDRALVHAILDEALVCHVAFVIDGEPFVIPTTHARVGDTLYVHGAATSRMLDVLGGGARISVAVTLLDGLVLARSAFHHSMNYRSVVLFGAARDVTHPDERARALDAIVDHVVPGRSQHVRAPNRAELAGTRVIALDIDEGSAKLRTGPPIDDADDLAHPVWAGVVPLKLAPSAPQPAPELSPDRAHTPAHVWNRAVMADQVREERRGELLLSTDPRRLDVGLIHEFLSQHAYWARGIPRARVERSLRNSVCVGVYRAHALVGFARLVTDSATFAYLCDVFVVEPERGHGIAGWMVAFLRALPELGGIRRWLLGTRDAHELYARHDFRPLEHPERFMEIHTPYYRD